MNVMTVNDYHATIEFDQLRAEFKRSLDVFLEICAKKKIDPHRKGVPP